MPPLKTTAKAAVAGLIAFELFLSQCGCIRHQIAKHKPLTLACKGVAALTADNLYFAVATGYAESGLAGGTDKELIILSLHPALMAYAVLGHYLVSYAQVLAVFLPALIHVP
jgi:hypothetical protein